MSKDLWDDLDAVRRRLPLAWWLVYDALVGVALACAVWKPWLGFAIGGPWLMLAAAIDTVEFVAKRRGHAGRIERRTWPPDV